jgi:hypothetical protein
MLIRRAMAMTMAVLLVVGLVPASALAQQAAGSISGKVIEHITFGDYNVLVRDVTTGQIVAQSPLGAQGQFAFAGLTTGHTYLVELYSLKDKRVVSTQGPYTLTASALAKSSVIFGGGSKSTLLWLLAAGAGAASAVAIAEQSGSK